MSTSFKCHSLDLSEMNFAKLSPVNYLLPFIVLPDGLCCQLGCEQAVQLSAFEMGRWNNQALKIKRSLILPDVEKTIWKNATNINR